MGPVNTTGHQQFIEQTPDIVRFYIVPLRRVKAQKGESYRRKIKGTGIRVQMQEYHLEPGGVYLQPWLRDFRAFKASVATTRKNVQWPELMTFGTWIMWHVYDLRKSELS